MIADLKSYPAYKDSGVAWLGEVPEHWGVRRLKTVFSKIVGGSTPSSTEAEFWDGDVIWVTPTDISKTQRLGSSLRRITREGLKACSSELVPPGSIIITSRAPVGNVALAEIELCTNQGCKALLARGGAIDPRYGLALMQTLKAEIQSLATGTTFTEISTNKLSIVSLPLPPPTEQAAIVQYLDHVDRGIRRYTRAKQTLMKLLDEQRQGIINHAVTLGIDSTVRLKPSGIPWLGNIPEQWRVSRSKHLFSVSKELSRPDDVQLSATQAYGVIPQGEYEERVGRRVVKISMHLEKRRHVEKDDFVISMRSFQGGLERAWASGAIRSSYVVLRPGASVDVQFFSYLLKSPAYIRALQSTADFIRDGQDLTFDNFCLVDLPLIPLEEQRSIAVEITRAVSAITRNIAKVTRGLDLIREYRNRLVADVVTGKLDVREVAANLPDEVNQEETFLDEGEPFAEDGLEDDGSDLEGPYEEVEA
jgi:type I restriction enzyme S subunit